MIELDPKARDWLQRATMVARELDSRRRRNRIYSMYPDKDTILADGEMMFARSKYQRHMEFFKAGAKYRARCVIAANRVGKTVGMGGYEVVVHLTGDYPKWWNGRRFTQPISAWAAGKSNETTRDILQHVLMGKMLRDERGRRTFDGTGLIPEAKIGGYTFKRSMDLIDIVRVKHRSGRYSTLGIKSYEQGRGSFEGTEQHVIWLDEEPPLDIYSECIIRTMTVDGIVMLTFTPLEGMSETVMQFMPKNMRPDM